MTEASVQQAPGPPPAIPSAGWAVLHLAFALREPLSAAAAAKAGALVAEIEAEADYQVRAYAVLGQQAHLGLMLVGPDFARLNQFRHALRSAFGGAVEERPDLGFVSVTEASEYLEDDGSEAATARRQGRLYPADLPRTRMVCFYPMRKRREAHANWYMLDFEARKRLMYGHGKTGRTFAGRVTQLITAATGLSDWEWGVTLFADDPKAIKDIVYEMRYDEGSALYAEFGPFAVGLVAPFADALVESGAVVT